jgi:hypothetical protein
VGPFEELGMVEMPSRANFGWFFRNTKSEYFKI